MACSRFKGFVGILAGSALFISSTGAVAASSAVPVQQFNPWAALAIMSGTAPVAALCNGATPVDPSVPTPPGVTNGCIMPVTDVAPVPPPQSAGPPPPVPVPPVEPAGAGLGFDPLLLALGAVLVGAGIFFLVRNKNNNGNSAA
jgi:hypothetical protein